LGGSDWIRFFYFPAFNFRSYYFRVFLGAITKARLPKSLSQTPQPQTAYNKKPAKTLAIRLNVSR